MESLENEVDILGKKTNLFKSGSAHTIRFLSLNKF